MEKVIDAHAKHMIDNKWVEVPGVPKVVNLSITKDGMICFNEYLGGGNSMMVVSL